MIDAYASCPWCDRLNLTGAASCWACGHRADVPRAACDCCACARERLFAWQRPGILARPAPWWCPDPACAEPGD